jgi:hypothetical protein
MTSFRIGKGSTVQKEFYFSNGNSAKSYICMKDIPFEITTKFRSTVTGEKNQVAQMVSIRPMGEDVTWNLITREIGRRTLNLVNYDRMLDRNMESEKMSLENIHNMKEEVAAGRSKMLKLSLAYIVTSPREQLMPLKKEIISHLRKNGIKVESKRFSDVKTRNRMIRGENEGIFTDPDSASYLIPVNKGYIFHDKGTFYGHCEISGAPIFMDRSLYPSSHELVLGMTGFGKSFFVKITMLREKLTRKISLKIIDPLGEYEGLNRSIGGTDIDLLNIEMNLFEKVEFLTVKENVDRALSLLITLFDLNNEDKGIIDTALTSLYEKNESLEYLKSAIRSLSQDTYNRVSPIFEGSLKMFSAGRNPMLDGDIRIDLRNVPKKLLSFYMLLSLDLLMRSGGKGSTNIVIDEAHYLLEDNAVGSVERYLRHARHSGISLILISQSSNDFLKNRSSIAIMENCSIHVLFRHQVLSEEMVKFYSLDDGLSNFLKVEAGFNGKFSLGLFYAPGFRTIIRVQSNAEEMKKIDEIPEG